MGDVRAGVFWDTAHLSDVRSHITLGLFSREKHRQAKEMVLPEAAEEAEPSCLE